VARGDIRFLLINSVVMVVDDATDDTVGLNLDKEARTDGTAIAPALLARGGRSI